MLVASSGVTTVRGTTIGDEVPEGAVRGVGGGDAQASASKNGSPPTSLLAFPLAPRTFRNQRDSRVHRVSRREPKYPVSRSGIQETSIGNPGLGRCPGGRAPRHGSFPVLWPARALNLHSELMGA